MTDVLLHPRWRPEDLGSPIPDSLHAVSVCLPTWADNIGYEEDEPRVKDRLATGYPRFVHHPLTRKLFAECVRRFARAGETCIAYPSRQVAELCQEFLHRHGVRSGLHSYGSHGLFVVSFRAEDLRTAKYFWQHTGAIVSSRLAEAALTGRPVADGTAAKATIRQRVAELAGAPAQEVYLYPSGMAAIYDIYRLLQLARPEAKCVQFGFPYTDTIKIQEKFGAGVHFFPAASAAELDRCEELASREPLQAIYCEFPSNPLLTSPDLERLAAIARRYGVPLVVDDTIGSFHNVRVLPVADVVVSSLTKLFSGAGDVMGGAIILNPESTCHAALRQALAGEYEDLVCGDDALVLEANSRDYTARAARCGQTAERLAEFLHQHPAVERLYYPRYQTAELYQRYQRPGGTASSLLSFILKRRRETTAACFDALRVCKGPNLGTNYTLCCPYAILAHYQELETVERMGVSRYLLRVSVGLEDADDLIARFRAALPPA
jgi:cystathionine gamma-synthase